MLDNFMSKKVKSLWKPQIRVQYIKFHSKFCPKSPCYWQPRAVAVFMHNRLHSFYMYSLMSSDKCTHLHNHNKDTEYFYNPKSSLTPLSSQHPYHLQTGNMSSYAFSRISVEYYSICSFVFGFFHLASYFWDPSMLCLSSFCSFLLFTWLSKIFGS